MTETGSDTTVEIPPSGGAAAGGGRPRGGLLRQTGLDIAFLAGSLLTSVVAFAVWVTGLSLAFTLSVLVIGIFIMIGVAWVARFSSNLDRRLAALVRGEPIQAVYRKPGSGGVMARLRCVLGDPQTWKDLAWLIVHSVIGFGLSVFALSVLVGWLGLLLQPSWWWALPADSPYDYGLFQVTSAEIAWMCTGLAVVLTPLVWLILRGASLAVSSIAAALLGPSEKQRLAARVEELSETRAGAVEASQQQLEQIERDLHDGAQARIVSVAMELGMAEQQVGTDPESAREPIRRAREGALEALQELRSLARGIRPALLTERGLEVAVDALIERSALPASLRISGPIEDTPEKVETAAYFVVAEALTNAIKHSGAPRVRISLERGPRSLRVTVSDEGAGGADPKGSGLAGMRKRVRALDGELEVSSPEGGPTVVAAELPCPPEPAAAG